MTDPIDIWLANCPDPEQDTIAGMQQAGLLAPVADYATLARVKAALVERTGLLGVGGIWSGRQLVFRHFLHFATPAQRAEFAGRALSVAISEPEVGAHPKLLTTRADPDPMGFRITGRKAWVSNGPSAEAIIVFAITAEHQGRKRYSAFLVPRDTPGLSMSEMPGFHALRPSRHGLLTLDGCVVPAEAMLGPPGEAYERMALPFRDMEDAIGAFGTLGALRHATRLCAGAEQGDEQAAQLGAVVGLTAVFAAGANAVVAALDQARLRTGDPTVVGLRLLGIDIAARLRAQMQQPNAGLETILADLEATLAIARGPRLARQTQLGKAASKQLASSELPPYPERPLCPERK
jgi:acyl-CoA dehydrogenase